MAEKSDVDKEFNKVQRDIDILKELSRSGHNNSKNNGSDNGNLVIRIERIEEKLAFLQK